MALLKLLALEEDDLQIIASCCQDSVLKVADLEYLARDNRFVLALNRFVWEKAEENTKDFERRKSVLHFERVQSVSVMGINRNDPEMVLSLLTIKFEAVDTPAGVIELVFAGDGAIRLNVECIEAQLTDLDAAWATGSQPDHQIEES